MIHASMTNTIFQFKDHRKRSLPPLFGTQQHTQAALPFYTATLHRCHSLVATSEFIIIIIITEFIVSRTT